MAVVVELPQEVENQLRAGWPGLERHALEGLVVEAFRSGQFSSHEVAQVRGLESRWDAIRFLSERGAYPGTDLDDLNADRATPERVMQGRAA